MREITRGGVMRAVALPAGLEAETAEATLENGLRRLRIQPVIAGETARG